MNLGWLNPKVKYSFLGFRNPAISVNTARIMRDHIRTAAHNPYVRHWAESMVQDVPDKVEWEEVDAIFSFLQSATRYQKDPRGLEYIQTPPHLLERVEMGQKPSIDCDDYTILGLSLLRSIGYDTKIRVVAFDKKRSYSHVYGMVKIDGEWTPFDAVRKDVDLGWETKKKVKWFDLRV